ncbi:MAG: DUF11 domain-containing protein, partial [Ilumatobacteraceae bacterium]|nr:DUF11 domain-containing protein [Ilumatobacteraceae bacterium]
STADNIMISEAGTGPDAGFDDEDVATVTVNPAYDLALVKTANTPTTTYDGAVVFTITVANQGNVPSGNYTITDTLPPGVTLQSTTGGGTLTPNGTRVVWNLPSIEPAATSSVTLRVIVSDITKRPFINSAEITTDSAAGYSLPAGPVLTDIDSTPGDVATSTVDNTLIGEAGLTGDAGFDDEDIARFDVPMFYDLSLVKALDAGQTFHLGDTLGYTITISNQGNVPSGLYSVQDALPDGLTFVSASDGATAVGNLVTWTNLPSMSPGAAMTVSIRARLDDVNESSYTNIAEIVADGSGWFSTPGDRVTDVDSSPALPTGDLNVTEDDRSVASLALAMVAAANATAPIPAALPRTGTDSQRTLTWALFVLVIGSAMAVTATRRRRKATR